MAALWCLTSTLFGVIVGFASGRASAGALAECALFQGRTEPDSGPGDGAALALKRTL